MPVTIPAGVTVDIDNNNNIITVKGKLGELSQKFYDHVTIEVEGDQIHVKPNEAVAEADSKHGLYRALIHNMVKGVSEGFEVVQEFVGVGYKAEAKGQILEMGLGFSHTVFMEMPAEIKIETINERGKNPILKMRSYDKQLLGQVAAKIRSMRKPEPYKGKGIKCQDEVLRRKAGKAAGK